MMHMLYLGSFKVLTTPLFLDSELLAALTPEASLPAASLLFFEMLHLSVL